MILLSGDFHNNSDKEIVSVIKTELINKYGQDKYDSINYHIILGDAGFLWEGYFKEEAFNYKILNERPFPVLCVFGNHDPVLARNDLLEIDIGIGENVIVVKKEKPLIAYLKRGRVYTIENTKFLVLGGALSIDKEFRLPYISWWKEEYWSDLEKMNLFNLLKKDNNFDYVLAHTGPSRMNDVLLEQSRNRVFFPPVFDEVAVLNEKIDGLITCGHMHKDKYCYCENLKRGYYYLYRKTALMTSSEISVL